MIALSRRRMWSVSEKVYTIKLSEGEIKAIGLHIADVPMSELHKLFAKEAIKKFKSLG